MPIIEFKCDKGHITERLLSRAEADTIEQIPCPECGKGRGFSVATRVEFSQTAPPRLNGEGFYKPSVSGPLVGGRDPSKLASETIASVGGANALVKQMKGGK